MKLLKMNKKGVFFSIMTVFLILTIISLNSTLNEVKNDFSLESSAEILSVSNKFNNIERIMLSLNKEGYAKTVFERSLPFNYEIEEDKNYISFVKDFPTSEYLFVETFDIINNLEVFFEDKNSSNIYDNLFTDINLDESVSNTRDSNLLSVKMDPYCYSYNVDFDYFSLKKLNPSNCSTAFDSLNIKKIIIDLKINSQVIDFDSIICNGISCTQNTFDDLNSYPFFELKIDQNNCENCSISQNIISSHINSNSSFDINILCTSAPCHALEINITNDALDLNFLNKNEGIDANLTIVFNDNLDDVYISGIDYLVRRNNTQKIKE